MKASHAGRLSPARPLSSCNGILLLACSRVQSASIWLASAVLILQAPYTPSLQLVRPVRAPYLLVRCLKAHILIAAYMGAHLSG